MSNHENLVFFNKEGDYLNFNYNNSTDRFEGDILFSENSSDTYKTFGIYTMEKIPSFEFESPNELDLNKFQLFNEWGLHFYGATTSEYGIDRMEPVNNDSNFYSKWIYGSNFEKLFPIGSIISILNPFLEFSDPKRTYNVVANKKDAIMIISDVDNATSEINYYSDYVNSNNYYNGSTPRIYIKGINAVGVYNYIDSNYVNNLSKWSEPDFYGKYYNGKKLNIINTEKNDGILTVNDYELTDSVHFEYFVTNVPTNEDLIIEYKSKTDLPNIYSGYLTIDSSSRITFTGLIPGILKPGQEFKVVGSTLNTNFLTISNLPKFTSTNKPTFFDIKSQVLFNNNIYECILAHTQSFTDPVNPIEPTNETYWSPSSFVKVDQTTYTETLQNAQVYLTTDTLYFPYSFTQSSNMTLAMATELYKTDFKSFNIDLYYEKGILKADLMYPSKYAEVNFYHTDTTMQFGGKIQTNERLVGVAESLNYELNYNISENIKYNIVFTDLDEYGIKIIINKEVYEEEVSLIYSGPYVDMERTIDLTLRNWLNRNYLRLNLLGINAELEYIGNFTSPFFNSIIIKSEYPNVPLNINKVEVGSTADFHIEHSRVLFTGTQSLGNTLTININGTDYEQQTIYATYSATASSFKQPDVPATLKAWVDKHGEYLATFDFISTNINNLLKFDIKRTDIKFTYTISTGKILLPGQSDIIITDKIKGSLGSLIASNEVILPAGSSASFEDSGFATGMVFTINNTLYPFNNQEYNIQYLDGLTLNLSYQGPFWGLTDSLCNSSPYVTLSFNSGFGATACIPISAIGFGSPFDLNQFDNTSFSLTKNTTSYNKNSLSLNVIPGSSNLVDIKYVQLSDSIFAYGDNLMVMDAINFTYTNYVDLPGNSDSIKIAFNSYNNYLYCLSKNKLWVVDPLINLLVTSITLTKNAYDMDINPSNGDIYITFENSPTIDVYDYFNSFATTITTPTLTDTKTGKIVFNTYDQDMYVTTDGDSVIRINGSDRSIQTTYAISGLQVDTIYYEPANESIFVYSSSNLWKIDKGVLSSITTAPRTSFSDILYNNITGELNISDVNSFKSFNLDTNNRTINENITAYGYIAINQYDGMVYMSSQTNGSILTINPGNGWNVHSEIVGSICTKIIYNPSRKSICTIQPGTRSIIEIIPTIDTNIIPTTINSIKIEEQKYGTLHDDYIPKDYLWLKSREYVRKPRENFIDEEQVELYWEWFDDQSPEFFLYDLSGDQLETVGSYSYVGPKPLIDAPLSKYPNKDVTKVALPEYQQTIFDVVTQKLDYINDTENISIEQEALQTFIGFKSNEEGPKQSILQLYKRENVSFTIISSFLNNTSIDFVTILDKNGIRCGQIKLNTNSTEIFSERGLKPGQILLLKVTDITNTSMQYISHNSGSLFKIREIYIKTIIVDFFEDYDYLEYESTVVNSYPTSGATTYLKTQFSVIDREIGRFYTYAQTEIEDIRYKIQLNNIGKNIGPNEVFLFKDYDILEGGVDWTFLNIKRKEMIMNKNLIYPYIGAYKSIINAINFFGYNDLKLNEYYRNIDNKSRDFHKLFKVEIPDIFDNSTPGWSTDGDFLQHTYPNPNFEETNLLNLTYDITDNDGNNVLNYSLDDISIKLQGLKIWLKNNIIPLTHKILDITGKSYFKGGTQITHKSYDVKIIKIQENMTPITFKLNEVYLMPVNSGSTVYNCVLDFYSIIEGVGADKNPTGLVDPPRPFNGVELVLPDYFTIKIKTYKTYKEWAPFTTYKKGDRIIYYDVLYESTIDNNKVNSPREYEDIETWSSTGVYETTSIVEYKSRIYVYSGLGDTTSTEVPLLDQGDNANWIDITRWSKIDYEPVQVLEEYREIKHPMVGVTQSSILPNTILPYNFTIDSNLDPFLVIEVTSDNGYGSIYRDRKNYEIRGIKDLTDKVVPIEQIGPFVPIKYV
jgi:hypothetical protein